MTLLLALLVLAGVPGLLAGDRGILPREMLASLHRDVMALPARAAAAVRAPKREDRLPVAGAFDAERRVRPDVRLAFVSSIPPETLPETAPVGGGVGERLLGLPPPTVG